MSSNEGSGSREGKIISIFGKKRGQNKEGGFDFQGFEKLPEDERRRIWAEASGAHFDGTIAPPGFARALQLSFEATRRNMENWESMRKEMKRYEEAGELAPEGPLRIMQMEYREEKEQQRLKDEERAAREEEEQEKQERAFRERMDPLLGGRVTSVGIKGNEVEIEFDNGKILTFPRFDLEGEEQLDEIGIREK